MNCCSDPYKNTIFSKSMMRSFRWIEMNCFNRFRFLTEVSTNLQKCTILGKNEKSKKRNIDTLHDLLIYSLSSVCVIFNFVGENCQNSFSWSPTLVRPFWSAKKLNFKDESCDIRILSRSIQQTYTSRKVKNQVLLFLMSWE